MDSPAERKDPKYLAGMALAALGVVFGDIGTSPLYALKECFSKHYGLAPSPDNVLGVLSMIIWTLTMIVSVKYVMFVMRADHKGEGGIMTLVHLALSNEENRSKHKVALVLMGIFGAALLYGDGIITPAISVLSAIEGLMEIPALAPSLLVDAHSQVVLDAHGEAVMHGGILPWIVPITMVILVGLFAVQRFGTGGVAKIFGPVMLLWFSTLALLGIRGILVYDAGVLAAFSPHYAWNFLTGNPAQALPVMGSVFLAATGAEALYADMGHFGLKPIRLGWLAVAMPALMLNYLGQGAMILSGKVADAHTAPFFKLAPDSLWASVPLVALATLATVIASQALITGAYSITMQAIQLGYLPRIRILHTSKDERGQIYIPSVNWFLMVACIGLVLAFKSSSNLAAAYGIAVTLTMLITTFLFYFIARNLWGWGWAKAMLICTPFVILESLFAYANLLKIVDGGWFPLLVGLGVFTLMTTWKRGRTILREKIAAGLLPLGDFVRELKGGASVTRVGGTAVFMAGNPNVTPLALLHNIKHNKVMHKRVIFLSIVTETVPHVEPSRRATITNLGEGCWSIIGHYGFLEVPHVSEVLEVTKSVGFECPVNQCTFFLSRETIVPGAKRSMPLWRSTIFGVMSKNAQSATAFFRLPPNRVVELGMQVEF